MLQLPQTRAHHGREFKKNVTSSLKQKRPVEKKAYKATWDSKSESEDEVDTANMCFMANTPKVTTQPLDEEEELSKEMLVHAFVELSDSYDDKKVECSKLEKEIVFLKNQLAIVSQEKNEISSNLVSTKREFEAYKVACKAKFSKVDENEFSLLKTRIVNFENVLKECAFNTKKLEEKFSNRHTSHVKNDKTTHAKNTHHVNTSHNTSHVKATHAHKSHASKPHAHYAFKYGLSLIHI